MLAQYLEQAAWEGSEDAGFDDAWYRERNSGVIIRRRTLARFGAVRYQDTLAIQNWISALAEVRSSRDCEVRGRDDALVAAGRADWVYVDRTRQVPIAIPDLVSQTFEPGGFTPLLVDPAPVASLPG